MCKTKMNIEEIVLREPLLSQLVSEEKLNNVIMSAVDINLLSAALKLKLYFLKTKKQNALTFPIEKIVQMDFRKHEDRLIETTKSCLLIQQSNEEYEQFLKFLDRYIEDHFENDDFYLVILKLVKVAIEVVKLKNLKDLCFDNKRIADVIIKAVDCKDKILCKFVYFQLLPLYFEKCSIQCRNDTLRRIFETENVDALCALSDFFLPNDVSVFTLISNERFWFIIQCCLNSDSKLKQKQGLYLLKKARRVMFSNWSTSLSILPTVAKLSTQDKSEAEKMWTNYITLLKVIREEHFYLIEPLFPLLNSLQVFDRTWTTCTYSVLLSHPNHMVVHTAFKYYLKNSVVDIHTFRSVAKLIVPFLIKCPNFKLLKDTYGDLKEYLSNAGDSFKLVLLQEGTSINWCPLTLWCYFRCMLTGHDILLPHNVIENYFFLILSLPHKYIRKGCLSILINCVIDAVRHKTYSFQDRLKIFNLFSKQNEITEYSWDKIVEETESLEFIEHIGKSWSSLVQDNIHEIEVGIKLAISYKRNLFQSEMHSQNFDCIKSIDFKLLDSMYFNSFHYYEKDVLYNYIMYRLENLHHDGISYDYIALIRTFVSSNKSNDGFCLKLERKAMEILLDDNGTYLDVQKQAAFNIVSASKNTADVKCLCDKWKKIFLSGGKEVGHETCSCFLNLYISSTFSSNNTLTDDILNEATDIFFAIIETQHHNVLPDLFKKLLPHLLTNVKNTGVLEDILMKGTQAFVQTSKCSVFGDVSNRFIESILINDALLLDNTLSECFYKIFNRLCELAKTHIIVALKFVDVLKTILNKNYVWCSKFSHVIINFMLLYKNVYTLSERSEYEVCQEIYQHLHLKDNPNLSDLQLHFGLLEVLQIVIGNLDDAKRTQIADDLTKILLEKYSSSYYKKRYFPNSEIHFFKQRIFQVLLFLQPHVSLGVQSEIIKLITDSFGCENHQASVRQLMQWLLIKLIVGGDAESEIKVLLDLISVDVDAKNKLFVVLAPVIRHAAVNVSEKVLLAIFEAFLPVTMGPQFKSRLYAQRILHELFQVAMKKRYSEVISGYRFLDVPLKMIFTSYEDKINEVLQSDKEFLFDFDPFKCYSLETIYVDIPKLNNVMPANWENFHNIKIEEYPVINVFSSRRIFSSKIKTKNCIHQNKTVGYTQNCHSNSRNVQKKINTFDIFEENCTKCINDDFFLIGSLVEKTANLGGLSRTCEVFGINRFVINNAKILEDAEFKGLSMTSDKWIDISEIKVDELKRFLLKQKEEGFEIVAAEQTTSSIPLGKYDFKKKTVLLLGNEKEGVPPDLLLLADVCVEIPQQGVVRSLNVHVAGALFMWEYGKQHWMNLK